MNYSYYTDKIMTTQRQTTPMLIAGDVVTHDRKTEGLVLGPVRGNPRHVAILLPPGKNRAARARASGEIMTR